jgi:hypothetical protein
LEELKETENDKIAKLVNGKLLAATEKMNEGIAQLIKESKANSDNVAKSISKLITKVDELKNKEQKEVDFSEVTTAVKELAQLAQPKKSDESEIIKGLIKMFTTELQNIVNKIQPKDDSRQINLLEQMIKDGKPKEEKKPEEWQFDIVRTHGQVQSITAKAIYKK